MNEVLESLLANKENALFDRICFDLGHQEWAYDIPDSKTILAPKVSSSQDSDTWIHPIPLEDSIATGSNGEMMGYSREGNVAHLHFGDDTRGILKAFTDPEGAVNEVTASQFAKAIGANVPETSFLDDHPQLKKQIGQSPLLQWMTNPRRLTIVQRMAPGKTGSELHRDLQLQEQTNRHPGFSVNWPLDHVDSTPEQMLKYKQVGNYYSRYPESLPGRDVLRIAALDHVLGNGDRNSTNYLITPEGKTIGIDHEFLFDSHPDNKSGFAYWLKRTELSQEDHEFLAKHLHDLVGREYKPAGYPYSMLRGDKFDPIILPYEHIFRTDEGIK